MEIIVDLLGQINEKSTKESPLLPKYIIKITAEKLASLLTYKRQGKSKNAGFIIEGSSTIKVDPKVQRGVTPEGCLLQNTKKINEIANTLLNPTKAETPRLYLGTLTWNVRPTTIFTIIKEEELGEKIPTKFKLKFETESIYLTDSVHRHLGIVDAYKQYCSLEPKPVNYSPKFEFSVELYHLDLAKEKELFNELNAKQKKITTAKQKEMDVSSPIGSLKDAIQDYDQRNEKLFDNNIEVSSNTNDKHTLLTMSVFVASIAEMFTASEIKKAREDTDLCSELSSFYCDFFYELATNIVVKVDIGDGEKEYHPYRNLYTEIIKKTEDNAELTGDAEHLEEQLKMVRDKTTEINKKFRKIDVANHNSFIKAFARLARFIRHMDNWKDVIHCLQTMHNIPLGGKFFQKINEKLYENNSKYGVPIATNNEDDTINVQVQTKTINSIYDYLLRTLNLERKSEILIKDDSTGDFVPVSTHKTNGLTETLSSIKCILYLPNTVIADEIPEGCIRLDLDGGKDYKNFTRKGINGGCKPSAIECDSDYVDIFYGIGIKRWVVKFNISWPIFEFSEPFDVKLKFMAPDFGGDLSTSEKVSVSISVSDFED